MTVITEKFNINTHGFTDIIDITQKVKIAPSDGEYHHDNTWHDGNGYAHVRASIIGNGTTVPLIDGALQLGQWQQIVLIDFDNKARTRTVYVQIVY